MNGNNYKSLNFESVRNHKVQNPVLESSLRRLAYKLLGSVTVILILFLLLPELGQGLLVLLNLLIFSVLILAFWYSWKLNLRSDKALLKFSMDNGFSFKQKLNYKSDGAIFLAGNEKHSTSWMMQGKYRGYETKIYHHMFVIGSGKSEQLYPYLVADIDVNEALPHVFIDYKENNFVKTEILNVYKRDQLVELEGDFNNSFHVYVVKNYEIEALSLLNPSVMHKLMEGPNYELELKGNKIFIYRKVTKLKAPHELQNQFKAIDFVIDAFGSQLSTFNMKPHPKEANVLNRSKFLMSISESDVLNIISFIIILAFIWLILYR